MVHARIDRLVYACRDPKSGAAGSLYDIPSDPRLNHRIRVDAGVCEAEAALLLRDFFRQRR
jgi:tRNA(adenine34) deaminase